MIKLGPAGIPISCKGDSSEGIKEVKRLGLQAMEVEFVRGVSMKLETAKEIGKVAKQNRIELSIHAPYYINLASYEKIKIKQSMKRILDSCERAEAMGAKTVVFHPAYYGKRTKQETFELVKNACSEMRKKLKGKKVLLGLETTGKVSAFGTLDEIIQISKKVKGCVPVVDFAHIFARNNGKIDYAEILKKMKPFKHIHSHFSGINYTSKGERNHLPIKVNKPPFKPLAKEILKRKVNITIISESPLIEKDSLVMKKIFEKLGYKFK